MAATPVVNIVIAQGTDFSESFTSTESDGSASKLIFNTTENKVQMYLGSEWKSLAFELDTYTAVGL